ncbi:hypothetical protein AAHA92_22076 [Salvia divinorum]|uniref:DELLA protein RGL1 n=1 Tax=Salvia divinorum TaxID=28513 RepID=A0ABD1GQZ0_SALDI
MENKIASQKNDTDGVEEWMNSFDLGEDEIYEQRQNLQEFVQLDDLYLDVLSPSFPQSCEKEIQRIISIKSDDIEVADPNNSRAGAFPSEPFKVLRKYSRRRHLRDDNDENSDAPHPSFSITRTIKLAAGMFVHSISELSHEDSTEVRLVQNLLSCAKSVAEKQHGRAIKFLKACGEMSSPTGSPLQRLAFNVSEALKPTKCVNSIPTYYKQFPVTQITNLVGSHTILQYLDKARRIHAIDLEIRSGVQWVQFMQDVAAGRSENPIHHIRITVVASTSKRLILEEIGRELARFADSVNLKFTFGVVLIEDVLELNRDLFDLNSDESVVVYASYTLVTLIERDERLDHVMDVIRILSPCIMLVTKMEANYCLKDQEMSRVDIESTLFRSSINNVLAAEEDERMLRHVPVHVFWRACFDGFGMLETELSFSSLDQANLLLRECSIGNSITLCRNGGSLIVGWKGTALTSLSAWKVRSH